MRRPPLLTLAWLAVAALLAPVGSVAQTSTPSQAGTWEDDVRALLQRRAQAVVAGDEAAFTETMAGAPGAFKRDRITWLRRLRALPLGEYRLEFTQDEYAELTREADRARHSGEEVHIVQVKERIGFRGYDAGPQAEDLFLTVVKDRRGRWSVVADDDAEPLALQSQRSLWDFGPVEKVDGGGVMVIYHSAQRSEARDILAMSIEARAKVKKLWPIPWHADRIVLMIPSTVSELARLLQTTFDLSTFVAFAAVSVDRSGGGWKLSGARVFLHWPNFRRQGAAAQRVILQHEFLHRASFEVSGSSTQAFNDEGIAQYYGEEEYDPPTPELRARIRAGRFDRRVPPDYLFSAGPPSDIYLAYEEAVSFAAFLGRRFGRPAAARLYRGVGSEEAIAPGTVSYHLDHACRVLFRLPFATLERDWARAVLKSGAA
jgi:hypothetical protein